VRGGSSRRNAAIRLNPKDAQAYYNRGVTYLRLGRHDAVLADYGAALRIDPKLAAKVYANRAIVYHALGRETEALADFGAAIRLDPTNATAYFDKGLLHLEHVAAARDQGTRNPLSSESDSGLNELVRIPPRTIEATPIRLSA
jgi:tetratricopeptide (TPR) repeat protein